MEIKDWPVEKMKLSELNPAVYNARKITDKAKAGLKKTLERFGMAQVIVWNKRSGNIVGGHQRYELLVNAGVEESHVKVVDLDDADEKALNVSLNNKNIQGDWSSDIESLLTEVAYNDAKDFEELNFSDLSEELKLDINIDCDIVDVTEADSDDIEEVSEEDEVITEDKETVSDNTVEIISKANTEYHLGENILNVGDSEESRIQADKVRKYWSLSVHGEKADWQEMTVEVF